MPKLNVSARGGGAHPMVGHGAGRTDQPGQLSVLLSELVTQAL